MDNPVKQELSKRKQISKINRKNNKMKKKLAQSYQNTTDKGSAIRKLMHDDEPDMDFDMINQITTGQNRKMKKKMKKLKKKIDGENADEKIFKEMVKYKAGIIKTQ